MANKTNSSEYLEYLMRSYRLSHVIFTAFEIGLFKSIIKKNKSLNELSEELQVSRRGLGVLLPALVAMEIIEKQNHVYAIVEKFRAQLDPNADDYLGNLIDHEIHLKERWRFLTESVRNGKPVKQIDNNSDSARTRRFIKAMASVGQRSASLFVEKVPFRGNEYVLDLGGGPGRYLRKLCESYPGIQVTLFDKPETIKIAQKQLAKHSASNRMHFIEGDIFNDKFGGFYDVILISNVIHIFGEAEIQLIFEKCYHSIKQMGRLLVKDMILNQDDNGPLFTTLFTLHMLLSTETGRCYSEREILALMRNSNFKKGKITNLTENSRVIEGIRI